MMTHSHQTMTHKHEKTLLHFHDEQMAKEGGGESTAKEKTEQHCSLIGKVLT